MAPNQIIGGAMAPLPPPPYRAPMQLHLHTITDVCPAFTDFVMKLFQMRDFISCCDDERDKILYLASKDHNRMFMCVCARECFDVS